MNIRGEMMKALQLISLMKNIWSHSQATYYLLWKHANGHECGKNEAENWLNASLDFLSVCVVQKRKAKA